MAFIPESGPCRHGVIDDVCWSCTTDRYNLFMALAFLLGMAAGSTLLWALWMIRAVQWP